MMKIGALLLSVLLCTGCAAAAPPAATDPASSSPPSSSPASAATKAAFTLVAHRGGALVYPESSAEAFEAVSKTAFPIETDLRQLRDGTLVPLHDDDAGRTMPGLSGHPAGITLEQWAGARIRHPLGGAEGTPTTWDAMLDSYGGRNVLVPELKDPAIDPVAFAETILKRGIQDTVVVQTFSFPAAQALARSGLQVLYLLRDGEEPDPASISSNGIGHVGPHKGVTAGYLRKLKDSGLTVWPYTVNDEATAARLRAEGADGVFTDTPWELAKQLGL
ncbi:glycerophosphodiester phosphodiesterase [Arthrobacter sp. UYEF36]|uniref:glycerophosphodiester phosphodiesterase n=1 Tax=Arthrobacter sp. UYEF36 TaxID=1756366 RepID=UPI00339A2352